MCVFLFCLEKNKWAQANLDKRWRTGDPKCWEEDVPIEPSAGGSGGGKGSAAAAGTGAAGAPGGGAGGKKAGGEAAPKIYIIEPKEKK